MNKMVALLIFVLTLLTTVLSQQDTMGKTCENQFQCADNEACIRLRCQDPCPLICGPNTKCSVVKHQAHCTCRPGFAGDPLAGCKEAGCGVSAKLPFRGSSDGNRIITKPGDVPWLAVLYRKGLTTDNEVWEQACGGSLISPRLVVTVAHCLVDFRGNNKVKTSDIKVGLGKFYTDFYKTEENAVIADVGSVEVPPGYSGSATFYSLDIGVVVLESDVSYSDFILPVCVDWISNFVFKTGEVGYVSGYGLTKDGTRREYVRTIRQTYLEYTDCLRNLPTSKRRILTFDKFCVLPIDGEEIEKGDTGGALTIERDGHHHLVGVASSKLTDLEKNSSVFFTDIKKNLDWLTSTSRLYDREASEIGVEKCISSYNCPDDLGCKNGRCENLCLNHCGPNTECKMQDHKPSCTCKSGYTGDPQSGCVEAIKSCKFQYNCPNNLACIRYKCVNPCEDNCGVSTFCDVVGHRPVCTCRPGYIGDPLAGCVEGCGIPSNNEIETLILNGSPTKLGDFPWLVALYYKGTGGRWVQRCAGTLISSHIVLTAAHCVVTKEGVGLTPEDLKLGLGKYYRDFYTNEPYSIIADVREIALPDRYTGAISSYALDVALLDLAVNIQSSDYIRPVCMRSDSLNITNGDTIHAAGWGTTEKDKSSEEVLSAKLTFWDFTSCYSSMANTNKKFLTPDKLCAGSVNESQVARGDSGGGLTVEVNHQHFIIGVVSAKSTTESRYSLFTDLSQHRPWLDEQTTRFELLDLKRKDVSAKFDQSLESTTSTQSTSTTSTSTTPPSAVKKDRYVVVGEKVTWDDAVSHCKQDGGQLATVASTADIKLLTKAIQDAGISNVTDGFWTGGTDKKVEGEWRWESSGQMVAKNILDWTPGQPDNFADSQHCLVVWNFISMTSSFKWEDERCSRTLFYVCENPS